MSAMFLHLSQQCLDEGGLASSNLTHHSHQMPWLHSQVQAVVLKQYSHVTGHVTQCSMLKNSLSQSCCVSIFRVPRECTVTDCHSWLILCPKRNTRSYHIYNSVHSPLTTPKPRPTSTPTTFANPNYMIVSLHSLTIPLHHVSFTNHTH